MIRHKLTRKTDSERLKAWLDSNGKDGWAALLDIGLTPITIDRMIKGQFKNAPRELTQKALCRATGMRLDDLFPVKADASA